MDVGTSFGLTVDSAGMSYGLTASGAAATTATQNSNQLPPVHPGAVLTSARKAQIKLDVLVRSLEQDAATRGVDFVTVRRVAEVTGISPDAATQLRRRVAMKRRSRDCWPLWSIPRSRVTATR